MKTPTTPEGWAIRLSKLIKAFHDIHGLDRFPIDVSQVAGEFSRQVFPDAPITMINGGKFSKKFDGGKFSKKFEGMLMPCPKGTGEWGIIYNDSITSPGRINFTLSHELGHYLMHRHLHAEGIQCSRRDMLRWNSEYGKMEAEANTFASFLLMPLDDFREQISGEKISVDLVRHLADRYQVSLTATILKWLSITDERAMIVVGRDGFIDWAWSSKALIKSGIFYRAKQVVTPLPEQSLAAARNPLVDNEAGKLHPAGIWVGNEEVHEMTILAKDGRSISMLLYLSTPSVTASMKNTTNLRTEYV